MKSGKKLNVTQSLFVQWTEEDFEDVSNTSGYAITFT